MYSDYILKIEKNKAYSRLYELVPYYIFLESVFIIYMLLNSDFSIFTIGLLLVFPTVGFLYICLYRLIKFRKAVFENNLNIELEVVEGYKSDCEWDLSGVYACTDFTYNVKTESGNKYNLSKCPRKGKLLRVIINGNIFGIYLFEVK